jgi:hypothetical protein
MPRARAWASMPADWWARPRPGHGPQPASESTCPSRTAHPAQSHRAGSGAARGPPIPAACPRDTRHRHSWPRRRRSRRPAPPGARPATPAAPRRLPYHSDARHRALRAPPPRHTQPRPPIVPPRRQPRPRPRSPSDLPSRGSLQPKLREPGQISPERGTRSGRSARPSHGDLAIGARRIVDLSLRLPTLKILQSHRK